MKEKQCCNIYLILLVGANLTSKINSFPFCQRVKRILSNDYMIQKIDLHIFQCLV